MSTPTPKAIRRAYNAGENGHFFDPDTMSFFGDTMASFRTLEHEGETYLYRNPDATVNVLGTWKQAGRAYFGAWKFDAYTGGLDRLDDAAKDEIYWIVPQ